MKITSVDVTKLPSGNAGSSRGAWSPVLVRVNTDEGISGGREDIRQACKYDWQPVNGKYKVPDLSGIGQEPAEETLAHCEIVRIDQYRPYMK